MIKHKVLTMKPFVLIAFVVAASFVVAQTVKTDSHTIVSKPNGYIRAENGLFSLSRDVLCAYSTNKLGDETHCYKLLSGEWKLFSTPRKSISTEYLDFAPCDPLNQLNVGIRHSEIAAVLPSSAAIKKVIETDRAALVAYSDSPEDKVMYSIHIAVLLNSGDTWRVAADLDAGAYGYFCGMRWIDQSNGLVALVYINEPAGSSDYNVIRSYRISWPR